MNNVMGLVAQPLYRSVNAVVSDAKHTKWVFFCRSAAKCDSLDYMFDSFFFLSMYGMRSEKNGR